MMVVSLSHSQSGELLSQSAPASFSGVLGRVIFRGRAMSNLGVC